MAWFKKTRKPISSLSAEKPSRVPEGLWVKCPGCVQLIYKKDLEENLNVCPKCTHHFRISVGLVLHPALPDCPGHALWKRDFKGSSGLFSFELKAGDRAALVDNLELFGIGYSWGGYESLAMVADPYRTVSAPPASSLVRLHIGLEDPDDLIADLAAALKASR